MSSRVSKIACIAYVAAIVASMFLLPSCERMSWFWHNNLPGMVVLGLAVVGALIAHYLLFDRGELSWWMTFWVFVALCILLSLIYYLELLFFRHSIVTLNSHVLS